MSVKASGRPLTVIGGFRLDQWPQRGGRLQCRRRRSPRPVPPARRITSATEELRSALPLGTLLVFDRIHIVAAEVRLPHDGVVDHPYPTLTNGAEGQPGLEWHLQLADDEDVERGSQRLGRLEGHRHPASRQAENNDVLAAESIQTLGQLLSGVGTIAELRHILGCVAV